MHSNAKDIFVNYIPEVSSKLSLIIMKKYKTAGELFSDLLHQDSINNFFNWCCSCIDFYAHKLGCTYEELNIYLFVIVEPLLILLLLVLLIYKNKQYSSLKRARI